MGLQRSARIILIGAPGVGKGTQTERLLKRFPQISALSSGDLLRDNVKRRTPLGLKVEENLKAGALVPDSLMLNLIASELSSRNWLPTVASKAADHPSRPGVRDYHASATAPTEPPPSFILDGFPRTSSQASQLDELVPINLVVNIYTPPSVIINRITDRWVHAPSGRVYNTSFRAPKVPGKDDITGEPLTRRADDDPDTWQTRLKNFEETSRPLLDYYQRRGLLWTVEGQSSDEISPKLFAELLKRFGTPQ
ncbi:adenylate kinase [Xylona heveae TC161]|uniref:GTP:AMP phosphotransferase, mitochondrial n=1 Tax=Xylona heveae (strain CBS 132557 / TC161) TaxID=1328760 RepID=A0A165J919_XYLHT|nr:adenylate kinase [Xylona heveae TC161]KZF25915.1 adenylate kinase [Xylona heveae TC161]